MLSLLPSFISLILITSISVSAQSNLTNITLTNSTSNTNTTTSIPTTNTTTTTITSNTTGSNDGTNPLIPTTISSECQSFLQYLNSDETLSACTTPILTTLSLFTPSSTGNKFTGTSRDINNTLISLCSGTSCSNDHIRSTLKYFNGNCSVELNNGDSTVLGMYDILYIMTPFTQSICSLDTNGGYCLNDIALGSFPSINIPSTISSINSTLPVSNSTSSIGNNSTLISNTTTTQRFVQQLYSIQDFAGELTPSSLYISVSEVAKKILKRGSPSNSTTTTTPSNSTSATTKVTSIEGLLPNTTTFRTTYLPFLFLSPNMTSTILCNTCSQSIMANYIQWETRQPYAIGLQNSPLLGSQGELYSALSSTCGSVFIQSINQKVGQSNSLSSSPKSFSSFSLIRLGLILLGVMGVGLII